METENINTELKNVFGNNHHPMLLLDKKSMSILAVNDLAVSWYGYSRDEFGEMTLKDLIYNQNIQNIFETLQAESSPLIHTGIWKHRKKNGSVAGVEITGSNIEFNGKPAKLIMIEEVTEKIKNNEVNNLLASIVESSDNAILSKTKDGIINSWNKAAEKVYGYNAEEVIGKSFRILIPSEIKDEFDYILKAIREGRLIERHETIRLRKDGRRINVSITISPIKDEDGNILGASSIADDITQDKILEYEHKKREKQLLEAQQIAHLGYWELDIITRDLIWSEELYKIYGLNSSQRKITYLDFLLCIFQDDRAFVNGIIEKAQIDFLPFQFDHRIVLQDGSLRYIQSTGEVIFDDNDKPVKIRGIGQDITARKRAERRLATQFEVTQIFAGAKKLDDAAPKILQKICEGTDWQIGELWLVDFDSNLLKLEKSWNVPGMPAEEFIKISSKCKFGPGVSLQGRVWESGKSSWSNNIVEDQFFPRTALAAQLKLHTALAFPIQSKNIISGVIALYRDDSTEPDKELLNMLDSLGQQIGDFIDRKLVEPALHESENLYKTLVEISPNAIIYTNLSGKINFCNFQAAQLFGFSSVDEIIGQNLYAFITPEDQKHAIDNEHNIIKTGRTKNVEYSLLKRDKTKFSAEINTSIVFNSDGKAKAFISIIRDSSLRKST
jgi:PAS domain S-box-containing protein